MGIYSSTQIESVLENLMTQQSELISKLRVLSDKNVELTAEVRELKQKVEACLKKRGDYEKKIQVLEAENRSMRSRLARIDALA